MGVKERTYIVHKFTPLWGHLWEDLILLIRREEAAVRCEIIVDEQRIYYVLSKCFLHEEAELRVALCAID